MYISSDELQAGWHTMHDTFMILQISLFFVPVLYIHLYLTVSICNFEIPVWQRELTLLNSSYATIVCYLIDTNLQLLTLDNCLLLRIKYYVYKIL